MLNFCEHKCGKKINVFGDEKLYIDFLWIKTIKIDINIDKDQINVEIWILTFVRTPLLQN